MKRIPAIALLLAVVVAAVVHPARGQDSSRSPTKTAIFAGGCFWCIQPAFDKAAGVIKTVVGYSGGTEPNPTYERVSSEKTGYRESIEITYDPIKISYDQSCSGKFDKPIATEILSAMKFYPAEAYHQKYYQQNPGHFEAFEKGSGRVSFEKKTWAVDR